MGTSVIGVIPQMRLLMKKEWGKILQCAWWSNLTTTLSVQWLPLIPVFSVCTADRCWTPIPVCAHRQCAWFQSRSLHREQWCHCHVAGVLVLLYHIQYISFTTTSLDWRHFRSNLIIPRNYKIIPLNFTTTFNIVFLTHKELVVQIRCSRYPRVAALPLKACHL